MLRVEDFEGLRRTKYEFPSDRGQMLTGYLYSAGEAPRGIIIIAHGFGAGHNSYMDCANYFAQRGYDVFAYDATGNDESEGDGVGGFPRGVIDLDHAITFVEESGNFPDLPIGLFGHSWGAYAACAVLTYHPEVKAVIACSGCNRSADLFEAGGRDKAGKMIEAITPFIRIYERAKFGKYAVNTAMDGFKASEAAILIAHSSDDDVLPTRYGYDLFYDEYQHNPRFSFLLFENRGHSAFFSDPDDTYREEFYAETGQWLKTLAYDYSDDANKERFAADKAAFIHEHLDRARWSSRLDEDLFKRFSSFYDEHLQD